MLKSAFQLFREKFDVILVTGLFIFTFLAYYRNADSDRAQYIWQFAQGLLYALLALLGVKRTASAAPTIQADNIENASTESGDIVATSNAPGDPGKEKKDENINPTDI